ncbi:hypothetical protein CQW23_31088 [Capsicum baccatum]|uniref:Carbohydrate kinase PfkB domain-containing protein n=1 Tax=Capsicum baccatum TaxID=33114 RepID=A0A2G2V8K2_CAPBA|nr:hypothetical protein CQW23_31088 [Capsicum baccatum]
MGIPLLFACTGNPKRLQFTSILNVLDTGVFLKTRTCIHTPGYPPMIPTDLSQSNLLSALDGAKLVYFDGRLHETAAVVAEEEFCALYGSITRQKMQGEWKSEKEEKKRNCEEGKTSRYCNGKNDTQASCGVGHVIKEWTEASSIPGALLSMLLRLPKVKFVIVTLGKDGCIMLQRTEMDNLLLEEMDVEDLFEKLNLEKDTNATLPICISSVYNLVYLLLMQIKISDAWIYDCDILTSDYIFIWPQNVAILHAKGIGMIIGKLLVGTAESIPQTELIDTTGAGDAFIGAVLYSICANMPIEKMLPFAAQVVRYVVFLDYVKTRTCIHTPGYPPMIPTDLSQSNLLSALDGAKLVYFDGRLHETAAVVAEEEWTEASSIPGALLSVLLRLPKVKFVIVTLGKDGCIMLQRTEMAICANMPIEKMLPFAAQVVRYVVFLDYV